MTRDLELHIKQTGRNYSTFFCGYGKVYTLADKEGNVFYVGCTVQNLETRLNNHIAEAKSNYPNTNKRKNKRIAELNFQIVATVVEIKYVTAEKPVSAMLRMHSIEQSWIKKYMDLGYDLCNREAKKKIEKIRQLPCEYVGMSIQS